MFLIQVHTTYQHVQDGALEKLYRSLQVDVTTCLPGRCIDLRMFELFAQLADNELRFGGEGRF